MIEFTRTLCISPNHQDAALVPDEEHGGNALHIISDEWNFSEPNDQDEYAPYGVSLVCDIDSDGDAVNIQIEAPTTLGGNDVFLVDVYQFMSVDLQTLIAEVVKEDCEEIRRNEIESAIEDGI